MTEKSGIKLDEVVGVQEAKDDLKYLVYLPLKFPQLFTDKNRVRALIYGVLIYITIIIQYSIGSGSWKDSTTQGYY